MRDRKFSVDRANGKIAGVCAGLANTTGIDATLIRIGVVLVAVLITPWILLAYGILAAIGQPRRGTERVLPRSHRSEESRERIRNLDLRMQAIETYVTSSNSKLAREIEELR